MGIPASLGIPFAGETKAGAPDGGVPHVACQI